ncbi:MAG: alpha/beta hydrolase [Alphaproteobacteria bacterium]
MPSPEYARVLAYLAERYGTRSASALTDAEYVAQSRAANSGYADVDGVPPPLAPDTTITPVSAGGVPGEWVRASGSDPARRLLWIHGGGWIACAPADYRNITEHLSRALGAVVLAIDYRLAPEHPFPAGLDDCLAAYRWLGDNGPATALWVAGDSAGGNLTLALLLRLKTTGETMPDAAATIGAATDFTGSGTSMRTRADVDVMIAPEALARLGRLYVQDRTPLTDPLVSPLFGDLARLPPIRMHVGDREVLLDDTLRFAAKARAAGVHVEHKVWPDMIHVFEGFCHVLPEARQSLDEIAAFLGRHTGKI